MIYISVVFFVFIALLLLLAVSVSVGRYFGCLQLKHHPQHKLEVVNVAESAVFALLALLIAFTFSGAYDRYETRKMHILEEANIFDTAYEYIDLVAPKFQPSLRQDVREYLDLHLASYNDIPFVAKVDADLYKALDVQHRIWKTILIACEEDSNKGLAQLIIPAMNNMFEVAHTGINMAKIHPPAVIFVLLIGLAALGAFLVGYNSADNKHRFPIHMICYVLLVAFTIYIIINMELSRIGFIRFSSFDQMLMDVREDMNSR